VQTLLCLNQQGNVDITYCDVIMCW